MATTHTQPQAPPSAQVLQMAFGNVISCCVYHAARLGIADLLGDGPKGAADLAAATHTNADALYRVLRALASMGMFTETELGVFALTPLADPLRSDAPDSIRAMLLFLGDHLHTSTYADMAYSLDTGARAFDHVFGKAPFEYLADHPEDAKRFDDAMTAHSAMAIRAIVEAYDFSQFESVADVGGGHGHLLAAILNKCEQPRGILFDLPHAIEHASGKGLLPAHRCELVSGDFFEHVTPGAGAYIVKHIIHDWDDDSARKILAAIRRAMPKNGKLLIAEMILPGMNEPGFAKLLDIEMLLIPGGRERTVDEYRALLGSAGLELTRVVGTRSPVSVIEAVPV